MDDLEFAKEILKEKNLSLVIVKNKKILFESSSKGIKDFVLAIEKLKNLLKGAGVADEIVGRAVAMLCIYSKIIAVFANTISENALIVLRKTKINIEFEKIVDKILNQNKTDICPFEKLVMKISEPEEAYKKIKSFLRI